MAKFKITRATQAGKTWQAKGTNPKTGRPMTISGGQKGVKVGPKNRGAKTVKSFNARHGKPTTPKKYINKRRWAGGAKLGSSVNIPNDLF
jgi:hypothetical protein